MNKEAESFYLEQFSKNFAGFPRGDLCPGEQPDFLIKTADGIIGIEITKFFRDMAGEKHSPLQQREAVRCKMMRQAKSIADRRGLLTAYVFVHFDLNFYCKSSEISAAASELVQVVEARFQKGSADEFIRRHEIGIPGVAAISMKKARGVTSYWSAPLASFVPTVTPRQLQKILSKKSTLCRDYRKKCNEIWLVIVMDRFAASSYSLIPDEISESSFSHGFDQAFLFCYDRDDMQKPPYPLRDSAFSFRQ